LALVAEIRDLGPGGEVVDDIESRTLSLRETVMSASGLSVADIVDVGL
jgi:hypothetical protein